MKKILIALGALLLFGIASPTLAANCSTYPFTLTNGQTADATQVMANFNSILNCSNTALAHNGANSDITSLTGLTTPLSIAQGGTGQITAAASLTALGGLSITNNLSDLNNAATARTNLGLGTAATQATGTSGATLPFLNGANTWSGKQTLFASTTGTAALNLPQGVAPTSPTNGDCWTTATGVFCQIAGSTLTLATTSGAVTSFNTRTGAITLTSTDVTNALTFTPLNKAGDTATGTMTWVTGTTTVAPFKFVAGTNLTAAAAGAMEWNGTNLFITQTTGPTRKTLAYTDGNITGSAATLTTGRTIAMTGDVVWTSPAFDGSGNVTAAGTIQAGAVTGSKIANTTITAANITNATITGTQLAASTVANSNLATMTAGTVKANVTGGSAAPTDATPSSVLDLIGATQGSVLYRGASAWTALTPGTGGQFLSSGGAAANPSWASLPAAGQLPGTATNDSASAGNVGEFVSSSVTCTTSTGLSNNTPTNITSISLTAGDWDVQAQVAIDPVVGTTVTALQGGVSTVSATLPATGALGEVFWIGSVAGGPTLSFPSSMARVSLASTNTVYAVIQGNFSGSTAGSCGAIRARRVR